MANPPPIIIHPVAMAGPASSSRSRLVRLIVIAILTLIIVVGISVLIIWLVVRPKQLVYTVEDAAIHAFDLKKNHLNATFDIALRSYNPNRRVSVYYDSIEVSVSSDEQTIAFNSIEPFFQNRRSDTRLPVKLEARPVQLPGSVSKDLTHQKSSGKVELDVRLKARIRFKVGVWKSGHRTLRVLCSPVVVHTSSPKNFDRTSCDVDV